MVEVLSNPCRVIDSSNTFISTMCFSQHDTLERIIYNDTLLRRIYSWISECDLRHSNSVSSWSVPFIFFSSDSLTIWFSRAPYLLLFISFSFDFSSFSLNSSPPFLSSTFHRSSPFLSPFLGSLHRFMHHIETRRTKETVTPQLAKLLIYSLFNQINERVGAHFYAPVQLFMVYGNCPKRTRVHRSRPRLRPYGRSLCEARLPDDRPFFFRRSPLARHSYVLYHFHLALLPTRFFVFPFRPVKAALRLSN